MGGEWSASRPGHALPPGKDPPPVHIEQEAGWAPKPVWTQNLKEKSSCLCRGSNLDRLVVQPAVRPYSLSYPGSRCRKALKLIRTINMLTHTYHSKVIHRSLFVYPEVFLFVLGLQGRACDRSISHCRTDHTPTHSRYRGHSAELFPYGHISTNRSFTRDALALYHLPCFLHIPAYLLPNLRSIYTLPVNQITYIKPRIVFHFLSLPLPPLLLTVGIKVFGNRKRSITISNITLFRESRGWV
jgi:hypothetical protein